MRGLILNITENTVTGPSDRPDTVSPSGEVGHWVTFGGRPIFISSTKAQAAQSLDQLKPDLETSGGEKVSFSRQDGTKGTRYEYPDAWHEQTSRYKFAKVTSIAGDRPRIENALSETITKSLDDNEGRLDHEGALAVCALLVAKTGMRPGSPGQGTKDKTGPKKGKWRPTFGATTVQQKHVRVNGDTVSLSYLGKSGVSRKVKVTDPTLAKGVRSLLGGADSKRTVQRLFQSAGRPVTASRLGERFRRFNDHYKTKDFRTSVAMDHAQDEVGKILGGRKTKIPKDVKKRKALASKIVKRIGERVSKQLGNTPAVAITNYTSPMLVEHCLRQYGFSPEHLEESLHGHEVADAKKASTTPYTPSRHLPVLTALLGASAVQEWSARFLNDRSDEDQEAETDFAEVTG